MTFRRAEARSGYLFAMPWFIGFGLFLAYPIIASVYFSFTEYSVLKPPIWVGTENYETLFADEVFWKTLGNTLFFAALYVPLATLLAFGLALLLNSKVRFMAVYRTVFFVPSLVPVVSLVILWMWLFNGEHGLINMILAKIDVGLAWFATDCLLPFALVLAWSALRLFVFRQSADRTFWLVALAGVTVWVFAVFLRIPVFITAHESLTALMGVPASLQTIVPQPGWLTDATWSKPAIVFMSLWGVGNAMVIYLAGLQEVPQQLYEAADLDGATPWQKTKSVTIPLVSPVILFNVVMGIIGSLQIFTQPYVMSEDGSPSRSIYFYSMYLFDNAFKYHKMGYASAMAWIMFLVIFLLTLVALKFAEKRVHYEGG